MFQMIKHFVTSDFESLKQDYYAIELDISANSDLYWELYGWNVDSILVLNPEVIQEVSI